MSEDALHGDEPGAEVPGGTPAGDEQAGDEQAGDEQAGGEQAGGEQAGGEHGMGEHAVDGGDGDEHGAPGGDAAAPGPRTLAIDVGGTGLKAAVLDPEGRIVADRVRVPTTYPLPPDAFVEALVRLVAPLPHYDRVSIGFPGVVRSGRVLTAPHFVTSSGPGSAVVDSLLAAWTGFDATAALSGRLGRPCRLANDADLQGLAVIAGTGLELVVTLGTGVGTGLFSHGSIAPHLELAQSPFRKEQTYNEQLGDATLQRIGVAKWRKRLVHALDKFHVLMNFDHCYIGGGNARHAQGHVDEKFTIVDNVAGLLGGIKLWDGDATHAI
ncbi:MAG: ROK family protein [Actinomycetota bacterium]|nr:ROK family protein [Actinomycetota bacterium]